MVQARCSLSFICLMVFVGSITAFEKTEKDSPQMGYYYDTPENDFELPGSNGKTLEEKQEQGEEIVIREKTSKEEHERDEGIGNGEHHGPGEHNGQEEQHGQGEFLVHREHEKPSVHDGHGEDEGIRPEVHEETEQQLNERNIQ